MATAVVVKKDVIPTVKGHFLGNSTAVGSTSSRHATTGKSRQVTVKLGGAQPNTDRRRYVTHK